MNVISNILYWISTGLLVPVIVLLIFFFIRSIILIGAFSGNISTTSVSPHHSARKFRKPTGHHCLNSLHRYPNAPHRP